MLLLGLAAEFLIARKPPKLAAVALANKTARIALQGSHGKPRPALIVQGDIFLPTSHVVVLLLTSAAIDAPLLRVAIAASGETGLAQASFAMLDRITTAPRVKIGGVIGHVDEPTMLSDPFHSSPTLWQAGGRPHMRGSLRLRSRSSSR